MQALKKVNFSLKEIINAGSATQVIKNYAGKSLLVTGLLVAVKEDLDTETGELTKTTIGVLKTDEGLLSSISPTVLGSIDTIINTYTEAGLISEIEEKGIEVIIKADKSAKGREFFHLELV